MDIIHHPSVNFNERPVSSIVDTVIIHYTGMKTGDEALARLCDPKVPVSAHYLIEEDGRIYQLVHEEKRAWHAGVSVWQGRENINHYSIGIELVHPGHEFGYRDFENAQIDGLLELMAGICRRHKIRPDRILGHSDIAPQRKEDPGELFPWVRLAHQGFGLWSNVYEGSGVFDEKGLTLHFTAIKEQLIAVGYQLDRNDHNAQHVQCALKAFQRHWCPHAEIGVVDEMSIHILHDIANQIGKVRNL